MCREPIRAIASSAARIPSSASQPSVVPAGARGFAETRKFEVRDPVTEFIDLVPFTFSDGTVEPLTPEEEEAASEQKQQQGAPDAASEKARIERNLRQAMDTQDEESGRVAPDDDTLKGRTAAGGSGRVDSKA